MTFATIIAISDHHRDLLVTDRLEQPPIARLADVGGLGAYLLGQRRAKRPRRPVRHLLQHVDQRLAAARPRPPHGRRAAVKIIVG